MLAILELLLKLLIALFAALKDREPTLAEIAKKSSINMRKKEIELIDKLRKKQFNDLTVQMRGTLDNISAMRRLRKKSSSKPRRSDQ